MPFITWKNISAILLIWLCYHHIRAGHTITILSAYFLRRTIRSGSLRLPRAIKDPSVYLGAKIVIAAVRCYAYPRSSPPDAFIYCILVPYNTWGAAVFDTTWWKRVDPWNLVCLMLMAVTAKVTGGSEACTPF